MPAIFNEKGVPTCCGVALSPHGPVSYCIICNHGYNTQELAAEVQRRHVPVEVQHELPALS